MSRTGTANQFPREATKMSEGTGPRSQRPPALVAHWLVGGSGDGDQVPAGCCTQSHPINSATLGDDKESVQPSGISTHPKRNKTQSLPRRESLALAPQRVEITRAK